VPVIIVGASLLHSLAVGVLCPGRENVRTIEANNN